MTKNTKFDKVLGMKINKLKSLFVSEARVKVLNHFFQNPQGEFYGREMAQIMNYSQTGIRRELIILESLGILKRKEVMRKSYFLLRECDFSRDLAKLFGYMIF